MSTPQEVELENEKAAQPPTSKPASAADHHLRLSGLLHTLVRVGQAVTGALAEAGFHGIPYASLVLKVIDEIEKATQDATS